MKTIMILGASGIIGQHMRLCIPRDVRVVWVRSKTDSMHVGIDLNDHADNVIWRAINMASPDAIVNLAGQADVDAVGRESEQYAYINAAFPGILAEFCQRQNIHYVHVSSQAVFDGMNPPYHENSPVRSINVYGQQKIEAEQRVKRVGSCWTIVRPSFVIGVRPIPHLGRKNPVEQMLNQKKQVVDRWFTACMAEDVARVLWRVAINEPLVRVIHVAGTPCVSRYDLAHAMGAEPMAVSHDNFINLSPRPKDTTFSTDPVVNVLTAMRELRRLLEDRNANGFLSRAREISLFTGMREYDCLDVLRKGFSELHDRVTEDFQLTNPLDDNELLEWYRNTRAYIWELTAYHLDERFNYSGMCTGVANTLKGKKRVLVLGDGIGDMTLTLLRAGIDAVYHDLKNSQTAEFAQMRLQMYSEHHESILSRDWNPLHVLPGNYDAICAADFMEHLPNVEEWVRWIYAMLHPGGVLFAQNAFACGSGPNGPMPMHLACNDRFEKDWDPLLEAVGFRQISSNWYEKPAIEPYASEASL